jgi:hypothetical protein
MSQGHRHFPGLLRVKVADENNLPAGGLTATGLVVQRIDVIPASPDTDTSPANCQRTSNEFSFRIIFMHRL